MVSNISAFVLSLHIIFLQDMTSQPSFLQCDEVFSVISTNQYQQQLGKERFWMSRAHSSWLFKLRFYYLKQI